ncbi:FdhD protein [Roseiarcus fermentans]|uniref:Sulfur carrier protein FdhD n=1 Tax=Roseiarcus fermentans TaxID=1473586 RepID=A0A366FHD2_9HYPH|nr:formate dehydrogenase accessory sulfurtransferase FdhD [Roseiarcus fermentans]RBP14083.1 FdhD protein [Roseiarcus fermentans]
MPPSEGCATAEAAARAIFYDGTAPGPPSARTVAVEAPVEIVVGGAPFAVMMATPQDLVDFAYGFALTERLAERAEDIRGVESEALEGAFRLTLALSGERLQAHLARRRAIGGRTGCGLCGVEDLSQMPGPLPARGPAPPVAPASIGRALAELDSRQPLNALTRAVHAAAWCARDGSIALVREDVGRHNALDKAIGALWRTGADAADGFFVITSRCSFEMVVKAAIFGARTLVSVSAPTSLALERARAFGMTVVAVARKDSGLSFCGRGGEKAEMAA